VRWSNLTRYSLRAQLEIGLQANMSGISLSAIRLVEELLYCDMEAEVTQLCWMACVCLLNNPILRPWVLNSILVPLVKTKPYFLDLLNKGFVDCLFRDIHRFRVRALLGDSSTQGCMVHNMYETESCAIIVKKLSEVLEMKRADFRQTTLDDAEFAQLQVLMIEVLLLSFMNIRFPCRPRCFH
jgi:hypothetical protein